MSKPVAVMAEVSSTASTNTTDFDADTGAWVKAGPLDVTVADKLHVGGAPVALKASQGYGWTGKTGTAPLRPQTATVTLQAKPTKVRDGGQSVLLDGDSEKDSYDNKVSVSASGKLSSG